MTKYVVIKERCPKSNGKGFLLKGETFEVNDENFAERTYYNRREKDLCIEKVVAPVVKAPSPKKTNEE